jgi:hypothetical protein
MRKDTGGTVEIAARGVNAAICSESPRIAIRAHYRAVASDARYQSSVACIPSSKLTTGS